MKTLKKAPKPTALKLPVMSPVKSSNILAIGHDEATNTLHVMFKGGGHYTYTGVPLDMFGTMLTADSVGGFLNSEIKSNPDKYKHAKIK